MALGAAVVLAVAAVVAVDRLGGESGDGGERADDRTSGGADGGGWASSLGGNSLLLATDGQLVCSTALPATLYWLDVATGEERLTHELDESIVTSPVLLEDRVLVGSARAPWVGPIGRQK